MLDALLMHSFCSSATFWSISARCGFVAKRHKFSSSKYNSKILVDQNSVIFQGHCTTCSVYTSEMTQDGSYFSSFPDIYTGFTALEGLLGLLSPPPASHSSEVLIKGKSVPACWGRQSAE